MKAGSVLNADGWPIVMQDDTWTDLQRSEAVYGDEPETVWQLYSAVQSWGPEVSLRFTLLFRDRTRKGCSGAEMG